MGEHTRSCRLPAWRVEEWKKVVTNIRKRERASEQAREREREIVFRIHRTYPTFAKCVPNYATSVPPPPLESIRFFILVKRHEPLLTRFQNFVGHSPPTCPAYFEPSFLRNCTLLPPLTGHEKSSQHPADLLFLLPASRMVVRAARTISAYLIDRRYRIADRIDTGAKLDSVNL